jgi:hypothetical protein
MVMMMNKVSLFTGHFPYKSQLVWDSSTENDLSSSSWFLLLVKYDETHSTPGVGLARVRTFLIFGTAERTPFARKAKLDVSRGKTLIPTPDIWQARVLQLAKCPGFTPEL